MNRTDRLVNLALLMGMSAKETIALPIAVENAAKKVAMTDEEFIAKLEQIPELRIYVHSACTLAAASL